MWFLQFSLYVCSQLLIAQFLETSTIVFGTWLVEV